MSSPFLINCVACGAQVSNQATACLRCGQPVNAGGRQPINQQTGGQPFTPPFQQYQQGPPPKSKNSFLVGCLGTLLIVTVLGTIVQMFTGPRINNSTNSSSVANVTSSQRTAPLSDPSIVERVRRGEQLFKKIKSSPPNPLISGGFMEYPAVTILVRRDRWEKLSKREQLDLTYYAESLVADARNNPGKYIDMPSTAPLYRGVEQKVRTLCAECWSVGTTYPSPHVRGEEENDWVVVGDAAWEENKSGFRASEFRRQE